MERYGEAITAYPLRRLDTGITIRRGFGGLVPEVEEREAARFNGYSWKEWRDLPHEEKVDSVAYMRVKRQIEAHEEDARAKEMKRKARRK